MHIFEGVLMLIIILVTCLLCYLTTFFSDKIKYIVLQDVMII